MRLPVVAAILMVAAAAAWAQPARENWNNLNALAPGAEIRVTLAGGKTVRGFFRKATAEAIVVGASKSEEMLARAGVKRVQIKKPSHRGRNTLIGTGIGTGLGLTAGIIFDSKGSGDFFGPHFGKVAFGCGGAVIGTVVGLVWPTGRWRDVYRAP